MRRVAIHVLIALVASTSFGQVDTTDTQHVDEYYDALSAYYGVPRGAVGQTAEAGIPDEELAVVFCIGKKTGVSRERIIEARLENNSWYQIAASHELTADDFYVQLVRKVVGEQLTSTYAKFDGLDRTEFSEVGLDDADIEHLVNLRFLYRHHNYSQYLIMVWMAEGKSFLEINHLVGTITADMKQKETTKKE
jgi:hypothetical protein